MLRPYPESLTSCPLPKPYGQSLVPKPYAKACAVACCQSLIAKALCQNLMPLFDRPTYAQVPLVHAHTHARLHACGRYCLTLVEGYIVMAYVVPWLMLIQYSCVLYRRYYLTLVEGYQLAYWIQVFCNGTMP